MSLLEWFFERRNPGPIGSVEAAAPNTDALTPVQFMLRMAFAAIITFTAVRLIISADDRVMASAIFAVYLAAGYIVRPRPDHSNTGIFGFIDHPLKWSDDMNRFLVFLRVVLLPGRITAAALRDLVLLGLGRKRFRRAEEQVLELPGSRMGERTAERASERASERTAERTAARNRVVREPYGPDDRPRGLR